MQPEPEDGFINLTAFYVVPNGSQKSSVFFNGYFSEAGFKTLPPPARRVFQLRPKWASHLFVHNVFDGDSKILRASLLRPAPMHISPCEVLEAITRQAWILESSLVSCPWLLALLAGVLSTLLPALHSAGKDCYSSTGVDSIFVSADMQERILAETGTQHESSWRKNYFMPAQADRQALPATFSLFCLKR